MEVAQTTGSEGQDVLRQENQQLKNDWESLQVLCKETQKLLAKCLSVWNDYSDTASRMCSWLEGFSKKVDLELQGDKKTPDDLQKCRVSCWFFPI